MDSVGLFDRSRILNLIFEPTAPSSLVLHLAIAQTFLKFVAREMLYRAELRAHLFIFDTMKKSNTKICRYLIIKNKGGDPSAGSPTDTL